ncbi:penicillin-binding protein activator [Povalibacter sp.]|uniref:penicillin-binding protein activator n=1 Tax=Povalibacter sp. TaxID=1962978 RepID=UPI002F40D7C5
MLAIPHLAVGHKTTVCRPASDTPAARTRLRQMHAMRDCALAIVALLGIASCTTPTSQPTPPGADRQLAHAEQLARDGKYIESAQLYETMAGSAQKELRDRLLLRAAKEYLLAGDPAKVQATLARVSASLPTQDFADRAVIAAELALQAKNPAKALEELQRVPQPLPRESAPNVLALRARAQFALNRPAAGVTTALERERLLSNPQDIRANQRLIWEGLQTSAAGNADFTSQPGSSAIVAGWLDLGRAALVAARNPFTAKTDLAAWRSRYPTHPANSFLNEEVLPALGVGLDYPAQVALVLPLSGRQQAAGVAIRDGFMAALLQQDPARRPQVNIYDTVAMGASTAYRRAVTEGAQFIVGPLLKEDVAALATSSDVSVLTLALNQLPDSASPPAMLFQYALDPEDEARQVARRAMADGRGRGLALVPNNEWGQRVYRALESELKALGGAVAGVGYYDTSARDFSDPISKLLLIDESRARANALNSTLGQRFEFEPRRRGDVQFVFMGAYPSEGRSLRPTLRFFLADDLPVYATSDIYEPDTQANSDLDGVIFPDMPWVISPDAVSTELRTALNQYWPVRARGRGRLYAFGFDAYRIVPLLKAGKFGTANAIPGMTGLLSIDERGRVRRDLDWARVTDGKPVPIGTTTTAAR